MIAGEASLQSEIVQRLYNFVAERIKEKPQEWVPIADSASELAAPGPKSERS
jgi:hypothetical protein